MTDKEFYEAWAAIYCTHLKDAAPSTTGIELELGEVMEQIKKTPKKRAPGLDGVHNSHVKADPVSTATWILRVFEQAKERGKFPEQFCEAKVILIPKGNPKKIDNALMVRPIALLNCWYKVIDGVLN